MSKKTDVIEVVSSGIDSQSRRIYFGFTDYESDQDGFSFATVEHVIRAIHKMASDNEKAPIELYMDSSGGDTYEMLRLYDTIQACPCQIKFFGSGTIASSATWIMAGCDERWLMPNTFIMLHKWSGVTEGTEIDHKIQMDWGNRLTQQLNQIYADNSRMPIEFWDDVTQRDLLITPEEAIMLGLADAIIPYKKRGNLRRKRIAVLNKAQDDKTMRKLVKDIYGRIHRGKNMKFEIHVPTEEFDRNVVVDDGPTMEDRLTVIEGLLHAMFPQPSNTEDNASPTVDLTNPVAVEVGSEQDKAVAPEDNVTALESATLTSVPKDDV